MKKRRTEKNCIKYSALENVKMLKFEFHSGLKSEKRSCQQYLPQKTFYRATNQFVALFFPFFVYCVNTYLNINGIGVFSNSAQPNLPFLESSSSAFSGFIVPLLVEALLPGKLFILLFC